MSHSRLVAAKFAFVATILCAWTPANSSVTSTLPLATASVALLDVPAIPLQPKPFTVPAQPIAAASTDGYLPSGWSVTPKGEFTFAIPLDVPPGRAGIAPDLSLEYSSGTGNGIAGVGWSVSGFSTITRGGRVWARDGQSDGVDYTTRDRFFLDGQELMGIDGTPYGGNGAEYRTASDTFVRVRSVSAKALDPIGPEQFTVELGNGHLRTYAPVASEQIVFDNDNKAFAHGALRVEWRLQSEQDASGNTMSYTYQTDVGGGGSNPADYWYETVPTAIRYTANLTGGQPTHGSQDLPQRTVVFEYEPRPDSSSAWLAGVQRRHSLRLKTIRMEAPNPTVKAPVWQYNLTYVPSGSQRSLLTQVQRCESAGGCLWSKQFTYSPGVSGALFQKQPLVSAPISPANYDLGAKALPDGEVPAMQLPDLNGDGASDLMFGPGAIEVWEKKYHAALDAWLPDGKFLGGGHSVWLSQRDATGHIVPLSQGLGLPRDEDPLSTANYGHVRLDEATVVDLDGDGKDELVAAIDNLGAYEVNVDPKLPPLYFCSFAELQWTATGFVHAGADPCTLLGVTDDYYKFYLPNEFPTFADLNGDGLPDRASPTNKGGFDFDDPNQAAQFKYAPTWKIALNDRDNPGTFGAPFVDDAWEAAPGVVTDLDGDGRAELTSEGLRTALTFDDVYKWHPQTPEAIHLPADDPSDPEVGYREFGDYNGDGTEDLLLLTQSDPALPGSLTGRIFWNTGKGFYADSHMATVSVDVHPDAAQKLATRFADPGIHVTDVDNDGRMDLVIFNNDHKSATNNQPAPQIEILFSDGNGQFVEVDLPLSQAGTRDDVKYWLDNALRPIQFYPDRLQNDVMRMGVEAIGQLLPGSSDVLLKAFPFQHYLEVAGADETPGLAAGWNLATLADTNGDGFVDIVRHVGGNDPSGGFEVLEQKPQWGDELIAVTDEATAWPALSIGYSSEWSDRPEVNGSYQCTYPLRCPKGGLRVVRSVTSRTGLTDLKPSDDPLALGHTWEYSYRDPVANVQGLGFFGFSEFRVWDTAPDHPVETITTFDLRATDGSGKYYPGVGVPASVTVAQPILGPGQGKPANASARLTKTTYAYEFRALNNSATHAVIPQSVHASQWEAPVAIAWSGQGPDHLHVSGFAEPPSPTIQVATTLTVDDYGNVTDTVTSTSGGLKTEVQAPTLNDVVNWRLGLIGEQSFMTLENAKNAVPVWQTTAYTYTSKGQIDTITVEPDNPDPTQTSTTTMTYDDYGLLTSAVTKVDGEAPRARHFEHATSWPGAPDEHLFASEIWAEHADPLCSLDCRPASWTLVHPAYGLPVAIMDVNGLEATRTYDGHGRPIYVHTDGEPSLTVAYGGRPDTFGGLNGLQATATSGGQQLLKTFDARGAELRASFIGFDGQWINTFATYDLLGRSTGISRPNAGPALAWTNYHHDSLGRNVETSFPDGSASTSVYGLLETEQTDPAGHYSYRLYDVDGRLTASGSQLPPAPGCNLCLAQDIKSTYQYGATSKGPVLTVLDDQAHAVTTQYDRRGRPVKQDDPSTGTTQVTYNGFGEPKQTLHLANGDLESETYDDLGRAITTTTPDGLTTYTWDVAANGIGRLARAMSPDQIKTEYRYDSLGRTTGVDQTDETNAKASIDFSYDGQTGRLASIDYPQAPGQTSRLRAAYAYNGFGYVTTVSDATPGHSGTIWQQITARNADLALVDAVRGLDAGVGGGAIADHRDYDPVMGRLWTMSAHHAGANRLSVSYNYDADGLVSERVSTDEAVQIDETFAHDALHRLVHSTRNGMPLQGGVPFTSSIDETYDSVGNRVDTLLNGKIAEHRAYGSNSAQPYALTERDSMDPANPNQPALVQKYSYDALGRLAQDPHRTLKWTAFDLPTSVTADGQTWTFRYDANHARAKKSGPAETVSYVAGLYEKHDAAASRRHVFHIVGSDEVVAEVTYVEATQPTVPGTTTVAYPLTDALGSTRAVADSLGTVAEWDYYDSWGQRSNPDGTPLANPTLFQSLVGNGFTNQEHDDSLGLVNMQGRMYDPALGRFLSADPIIGSPVFSQSWNSYSYVLNSPINFTDPSGLDCTPSMAVATGSEKSFIASGQCGNGASAQPSGAQRTEGGSAVGSTWGAAAGAISGGFAYLQDMRQQLQEQHDIDVRTGTTLADGTKIRSADGTPIPRRRINALKGNRLEDNWGYPIHGGSGGRVVGSDISRKAPVPENADSLATRRVADFAVRLGCGSKCSEASAPTNAREAAAAPRQLSNARVARNAVSQALAARAVVKLLGKVGVIIDEGVDGLFDWMMPPGMEMTSGSGGPPKIKMEFRLDPSDEEEYALTPVEELEEAQQRYDTAFASYSTFVKQISEARRTGYDFNGTPFAWVEAKLERDLADQKKWVQEAAAALAEARLKVGKITPL